MFYLHSKFKPTGDQPQAIEKLVKNLKAGAKNQVLLGVTGSGKTFTLGNVIEKIQKPILIISHNKVLAAQLYQEFKEFFPGNGVHYFVSYYDYYQPEAYIPQTDTYIEKDAKINQEIDKLRHFAVQDLLTRKDVIIVASVSCIYNIGSPETYQKVSLEINQGQEIKRKKFLSHLISLQYQRNDIDFKPGTFRVRGDTIEVYLVTGEEVVRIEFFGDKIEKILKSESSMPLSYKLQVTRSKGARFSLASARRARFAREARRARLAPNGAASYRFYPAQFWVTPQEKLNIAIENIKGELQETLQKFKKQGKLLEAQRLEMRTNYDLEMLKETGYCHGIENYSRHLEFRAPGDLPFTLLDYFPEDFLLFVDESHMTVPQLNAMYNTDRSRKEVLIKHGFRLPSALDNRPLSFKEVEKKIKQAIFVSATPGPYEMLKINPPPKFGGGQSASRRTKLLVEQLIRPTGLLEPSIKIRPTKNQVKDLIGEIRKRIKKLQRTLVITLTKRLAEELSDYLKEQGIKTNYLHSEIKTLERPKILKKLREGEYDVIVGINILREGLDLPEVALVAILDADKEGFLRSETTLIQTMGRAARHLEGHVILYADKITTSMKKAINEVKRRRNIQIEYNKTRNITPKPIVKEIRDWPFASKEKDIISEFGPINDIKLLEKEMKEAAKNLDFERAAEIRDLIKKLKKKDGK